MDARTEARWDHDRDLRKHEPSPRHQKRAVSELVACCHALIVAGYFGPEVEKIVRARVRNVCIEFDMDPPPEPTPAAAISRVMLRDPS